MTVIDSTESELDEAGRAYARLVGVRLRGIRRQKRMSLQEVERDSALEFKASVLGAYERGERAISVPRLQRLARFYRVPVSQLLPSDSEDGAEPSDAGRAPEKLILDLTKLDALATNEGALLGRYLGMIQVQRQDFNGRMLTIRGDDLRAVACILNVSVDGVRTRLDEMGVAFHP